MFNLRGGSNMGGDANGLAETYRRDGFVFPIDVLSDAEAQSIRADLEAAEAELAADPERSALLRGSVNHLLPSFDALARNDKLLAAASQVLGPDLLVWSAGLFIKEAHSAKVVTWHQDLTYWGLDDVEETTGWVALSPATIASGCMRFVPASHRRRIVPHLDTFAADNLLSRGQEIAVEVDEDDGVAVELHSGQASLHHGHLFHASGPNSTGDRRIGVAIRYIKPTMRQRTGERWMARLASGEDRYGHFDLADPPRGRLHEADFERCRRDSAVRRSQLFAGADPSPHSQRA
jgi:ectoine hydroxylase-related dioxygenase (phytanoyl-CoA dioxygenase family)